MELPPPALFGDFSGGFYLKRSILQRQKLLGSSIRLGIEKSPYQLGSFIRINCLSLHLTLTAEVISRKIKAEEKNVSIHKMLLPQFSP